MNIYEKILAVQTELKAPKSLYNKFGKYYYRNAESILESVKPICRKYGLMLTIKNEPVCINEKFFLKATGTLINIEKPEETFSAESYVEMDFSHAGMSAEQKGGCAISYCDKYMLNGLFLLDDNKDPDTDEYHVQTEEAQKPEVKEEAKKEAPKRNPDNLSDTAIKDLKSLTEKANLTDEQIFAIVKNGTGVVVTNWEEIGMNCYPKLKAALLQRIAKNGNKSEA